MITNTKKRYASKILKVIVSGCVFASANLTYSHANNIEDHPQQGNIIRIKGKGYQTGAQNVIGSGNVQIQGNDDGRSRTSSQPNGRTSVEVDGEWHQTGQQNAIGNNNQQIINNSLSSLEQALAFAAEHPFLTGGVVLLFSGAAVYLEVRTGLLSRLILWKTKQA